MWWVLVAALLVAPEVATAADLILADDVTLTAGRGEFEPVLLQNAWQRCSIRLNRVKWRDPMAALQVHVFLTLDRGETWISWGGVADQGGQEPPRRPGSPLPELDAYFESALPAGTLRGAKVLYSVVGKAVKTTIILQCR